MNQNSLIKKSIYDKKYYKITKFMKTIKAIFIVKRF